MAHRIADAIEGNTTLLDVGSGAGEVSRELSRLAPGLKIVQADIRMRVPLPRAVQCDGVRLPFAPSSFDTVVLLDVLHHTEDPAQMLREAKRVTKKRLVVKDHIRHGALSMAVLVAMDWAGNAPYGTPVLGRYLTWQEWNELFRSVGLRVASLDTNLGLYSPWLAWVCERSYHFLAVLESAE